MIHPLALVACRSARAVAWRYMKPVNGFTSSFHNWRMRSQAAASNTLLKMTYPLSS